ncbi:hypothetical protein BC939DRAFT_449751 [Gamsiella multidivaricata]|uniref:uncharacterized protein n=1 Tax=Gamsiella multidivaricata TaxID=101098 RepID=UPI00221ED222|nr:uncharacterized protein BC939DRAFT_449751 [Gamsiella multidivaricata]KAI7824684.1 hypothetical protein BC939DRAFT_449751 [Gamsiella multidivaricata]
MAKIEEHSSTGVSSWLSSQSQQQQPYPSPRPTSDFESDTSHSNVTLAVGISPSFVQLLGSVPEEIWRQILVCLPLRKLVILSVVCRKWYSIVHDDLVPAYKDLAAQCRMGEPRGLIQTWWELVVGHALIVCDVCLQRSRGVGSAVPLPVERTDAMGRTWMCRRCRRKYFERHPEERRKSWAEDYVGVGTVAGMWTMCSVPMRADAEGEGEGGEHRVVVQPLDSRECFEHADEVGQEIVYEARVRHGGDIGIRAHHGDHSILSLLRPYRRKLLSTLLALRGLKLRADSKLCGRYLQGSNEDPERIADVMKEMEWYYQETTYGGYLAEDHGSVEAKAIALTEWVEEAVRVFGEKVKEAYKQTPEGEGNAFMMVEGELVRMPRRPPPETMWAMLDLWIDKWQQGDRAYRPQSSALEVSCEADDLRDD